MKRIMTRMIIAAALSAGMMMAGCGGGGGDDKAAAPTKAAVRLSTVSSPSVTGLVGVQAAVHLPAGVSVKTMLNSTQTDTNVVIASGNTAPAGPSDLFFGVYSAASRTVAVYVVKVSGFATGEFATVNCDITSGTPKASDFSIMDLVVSDSTGSLITGLTPSITVTFH